MPRLRNPAGPFRYINTSPEIIRLIMTMYVRFALILRNGEDLLFECGSDIYHETVPLWWNRELTTAVAANAKTAPAGVPQEYVVFQPEMGEKYQMRLFETGAALYGSLGIEPDDNADRYSQLMDNFTFFGAPVGTFFAIRKDMGPPQWAYLGMLIQIVMLAAREEGLHTRGQESWAMWHHTLREELDIPKNLMVYCGLSPGFMDEDAPVNHYSTAR